MIVLGSPEKNNQIQIDRIKTILDFKTTSVVLDDDFYSDNLNLDMKVLDIGQSLRDKSGFVLSRVAKLETLDINVFKDYPDIQMDLCEELDIPAELKYDIIFCFSLLEHCYNPFTAADNLFNLLKPNSKVIGSAPFLFPHHCPEDLSYQDYFRFTKYSFVSLFPKATKIVIWPHRGRVGAGLNIISQRYKDILEQKFNRLSRFVNSIDKNRRPQQSSGFHFEIYN